MKEVLACRTAIASVLIMNLQNQPNAKTKTVMPNVKDMDTKEERALKMDIVNASIMSNDYWFVETSL